MVADVCLPFYLWLDILVKSVFSQDAVSENVAFCSTHRYPGMTVALVDLSVSLIC